MSTLASRMTRGSFIKQRTVGIYRFIGIGFFYIAFGIYGNELLISSGSPAIILWFLIGVGLLFGLPIALITAEICTKYPENGGPIVPIRYSLGIKWSNHAACLCRIYCLYMYV